MSDDAPPPLPGLPFESDAAAGTLSTARIESEHVESVLADFRTWLTEAQQAHAVEPQPAAETVDLFTLIGQFTALRHEVNLQTKASRTAVEQNTETLKRLTQPEKPPADPDEAFRPLAKAIIDIADALTIAWKQVEKAKATLEPLLIELAEPDTVLAPEPRSEPKVETVPTEPPGFWARLFGVPNSPAFALQKRAPETVVARQNTASTSQEVADRLEPLLAGIADGYAMSLRRVERVLPQFNVTPIESLGQPFDPELMEVVEVVESDDENSGTVVEEVRRGYRWKEKMFRFAQVKVAR